MEAVTAEKMDSLTIELKPRSYPRSWNALDPTVAAWLDPADLQTNAIILIGNIDHENSVRIAEKLREAGKSFLWLGHSEAAEVPANYRVSKAWQDVVRADQRNAVRTITILKTDSGWQMYEGLWDKMP